MNFRSKILGMLVGGAIGDALGMGVETWTPEKILEVHPNGITKYVQPIGHKWFNPETMPAGTITDDTQLTIATLKGLVTANSQDFNICMDAIAKAHVEAMKETTAGWGKSTKEACRRLANGVSWLKSGITTEEQRGTGNGIPMKCSPISAWLCSADFHNFDYQNLVNYAAMTHYNEISAHACVAHVIAVRSLLLIEPEKFNCTNFIEEISTAVCLDGIKYNTSHLQDNYDLLINRFNKFREIQDFSKITRDQIVEYFGDGSCYVYTSLPFSYAYFLRKPHDASVLQDVVEAGGDTDTNAKMVGELLGALHGLEFFQTEELKWTIDGLKCYSELLKLGQEFCDILGFN